MVHVANVERATRFWSHFGFGVTNSLGDHEGRLRWAFLASDGAQIMFARADEPLDQTREGVLFYLYTHDLVGLRERLLAVGLRDGGDYAPGPRAVARGWGSCDPRGIVSTIHHPEYMPAGEIRVEDADGYCVLIGQME